MAYDPELLGGKEVRIERDLDLLDPAKALKQINALKSDIDRAIVRGLDKAIDSIVDKLKFYMDEEGVPQLKNSIVTIPWPKGFEIQVGSDSDPTAIFVEYGTGIVGSESPHPEEPWDYDIHKHGDRGWYAPLDMLDPSIFKVVKDGKPYGRTWGMPSRPYFYKLQKWVQSYGIIARKINAELRKL